VINYLIEKESSQSTVSDELNNRVEDLLKEMEEKPNVNKKKKLGTIDYAKEILEMLDEV
jgi:hypothetical protein